MVHKVPNQCCPCTSASTISLNISIWSIVHRPRLKQSLKQHIRLPLSVCQVLKSQRAWLSRSVVFPWTYSGRWWWMRLSTRLWLRRSRESSRAISHPEWEPWKVIFTQRLSSCPRPPTASGWQLKTPSTKATTPSLCAQAPPPNETPQIQSNRHWTWQTYHHLFTV